MAANTLTLFPVRTVRTLYGSFRESERGWSGWVTHQCLQCVSGMGTLGPSHLLSQQTRVRSLLTGVTPPGAPMSLAALNWAKFTRTDAQYHVCEAQLHRSGESQTKPSLPTCHLPYGRLRPLEKGLFLPKWNTPYHGPMTPQMPPGDCTETLLFHPCSNQMQGNS